MRDGDIQALRNDAESLLGRLLVDPNILAPPGHIELTDVEWHGVAIGNLELALQADGVGLLECEDPSLRLVCRDPADWAADNFKARTKFGAIELRSAACALKSMVPGKKGTRATVQLQAWHWTCGSPERVSLVGRSPQPAG